jgi:hypothetical protein
MPSTSERRLRPWIWVPLPLLLVAPCIFGLTLGMSLFKLPVSLGLLLLKFAFWVTSASQLDFDFLKELSEPLGGVALLFLLVALAVPAARRRTRLLVALPLFLALLALSTLAFFRLESFIQAQPAPAASAPGSAGERHDAALKRARSAVIALAYSARTGAKPWQPEVQELETALEGLSPDETYRNWLAGSLGLSPNDDVSGIFLEAIGMEAATFELDPAHHVFGAADTYACSWVLLFVGLGLLMQTGRVALWEWGGVLFGLQGNATYVAQSEAGWHNMLGTIVLALLGSVAGVYGLPALGMESLYSPTLMNGTAPAWFTLGVASVSVLSTAAIADFIHVWVTLGFIRAGKDPSRTHWDGLLITLVTTLLLHFFFFKAWSASLVSLACSVTVQTAVVRLGLGGAGAWLAARSQAIGLRAAAAQTVLGLGATWGFVMALCVWGLSNEKRTEDALNAKRLAEGTPFDFSFDVQPGGEGQVRQLVQGAAYVTRVKVTGGRVDIFFVNGYSSCQNPSMRGGGPLGSFEAPYDARLPAPGLFLPAAQWLCAHTSANTAAKVTISGHQFDVEKL